MTSILQDALGLRSARVAVTFCDEARRDLRLLGVGSAFFYYRANNPQAVDAWSVYGQLGPLLPDATVTRGGETTALKITGPYRPYDFASLHQHCSDNDLAYEVW